MEIIFKNTTNNRTATSYASYCFDGKDISVGNIVHFVKTAFAGMDAKVEDIQKTNAGVRLILRPMKTKNTHLTDAVSARLHAKYGNREIAEFYEAKIVATYSEVEPVLNATNALMLYPFTYRAYRAEAFPEVFKFVPNAEYVIPCGEDNMCIALEPADDDFPAELRHIRYYIENVCGVYRGAYVKLRAYGKTLQDVFRGETAYMFDRLTGDICTVSLEIIADTFVCFKVFGERKMLTTVYEQTENIQEIVESIHTKGINVVDCCGYDNCILFPTEADAKAFAVLDAARNAAAKDFLAAQKAMESFFDGLTTVKGYKEAQTVFAAAKDMVEKAMGELKNE